MFWSGQRGKNGLPFSPDERQAGAMGGRLPDDSPEAAAAAPCVFRRQSSSLLVNRELAPQQQQQQAQRPNVGPWLKHEQRSADASAREFHFQHRTRRRVPHLDNIRPDLAIRPLTPSTPTRANREPVFSPRWDSLSAGASPITSNFSSFGALPSPRTRAESLSPTLRPTPRSAFPGLSSNPFIPEIPEETRPLRPRARKFPLLGRQDEADPSQPLVSPFPDANVDLAAAVEAGLPAPTIGAMTV